MSVFHKILRAGEGRTLKRLEQRVIDVNALEPEYEALSDDQLAAKTIEFRERFDQGEDLDELLPEAFAAVREASKRSIGLRPFDVQLIGGMVLHEGRIAEMKTGEGKTLVATLPLYLNAIAGVNVHLVTVNDYLARRDAAWMGPIYQALGIVEAVDDDAGGEAEEGIDPAHPFGVATGEIVVDGDDMHALAGERVEVDGERGD